MTCWSASVHSFDYCQNNERTSCMIAEPIKTVWPATVHNSPSSKEEQEPHEYSFRSLLLSQKTFCWLLLKLSPSLSFSCYLMFYFITSSINSGRFVWFRAFSGILLRISDDVELLVLRSQFIARGNSVTNCAWNLQIIICWKNSIRKANKSYFGDFEVIGSNWAKNNLCYSRSNLDQISEIFSNKKFIVSLIKHFVLLFADKIFAH